MAKPRVAGLDKSKNIIVSMSPARWRAILAIVMSSMTMMESALHQNLAMSLYEELARKTGVDIDPIHIAEVVDDDEAYVPTQETDLSNICEVETPGWYCTRTPGHEGPCAALPWGD